MMLWDDQEALQLMCEGLQHRTAWENRKSQTQSLHQSMNRGQYVSTQQEMLHKE